MRFGVRGTAENVLRETDAHALRHPRASLPDISEKQGSPIFWTVPLPRRRTRRSWAISSRAHPDLTSATSRCPSTGWPKA